MDPLAPRLITRRGLVQAAAIGCLGLSLPRPLRADARRGPGRRLHPGVPERRASYLDMWDLKPAAPAEIRGEFKPIPTTVPGVQLSEHPPRLSGRRTGRRSSGRPTTT